MSHNRRTLQDEEHLVPKRPLTQQNGGPGVSMLIAAARSPDAESRLSAGNFAVRGVHSGWLLEPNLPQPVHNNKTVGLVAREGADADGN